MEQIVEHLHQLGELGFEVATSASASWIVSLKPVCNRRSHDMSEVAYRSKVSIEREKGPLRWATLPAEPGRIAFGVHDEVASHYGVAPDASPPHATTLDYIVAAAAG